MPSWWFNASVKVISPVLLVGFFIWNVVDLFRGGGLYGGYSIALNIIFGWLLLVIMFASTFIAKFILKKQKEKGFIDEDISWDDLDNHIEPNDKIESNDIEGII